MKFHNQSDTKVQCCRLRPNLTAEIIGFFPEKSPFSHIKLMTLVMTLLLLTFPVMMVRLVGSIILWSLTRHTIYPGNNMCQKCGRKSGLWVLHVIVDKTYAENMKKSWVPFGSYLLNSTANPAHFHSNWAELAVLFSR